MVLSALEGVSNGPLRRVHGDTQFANAAGPWRAHHGLVKGHTTFMTGDGQDRDESKGAAAFARVDFRDTPFALVQEKAMSFTQYIKRSAWRFRQGSHWQHESRSL